jgi:hypothetical protein
VQKFTDRENVLVPVRNDQPKRVANQPPESANQADAGSTPGSSEETA